MQSSRRSVVAAGASNQSGTGWGAGGVGGAEFFIPQLVASPFTPPTGMDQYGRGTTNETVWNLAGQTGTVHTPLDGAQLQTAYDTAAYGDVIFLDSSITYTLNGVLPAKTWTSGQWIYVISGPAYAGTFIRQPLDNAGGFWLGADWCQWTGAKLYQHKAQITDAGLAIMQSTTNAAGILPVLTIQDPTTWGAGQRVAGWRFVGIHFRPHPSAALVTDTMGELVSVGCGSTLAQQPHEFIWDRCVGAPLPSQNVNRIIRPEAYRVAIINSDFGPSHVRNDGDTQAIAGWNGAQRVKIANCTLSAMGEVIGWGGADSASSDLAIRDLEQRRTPMFSPKAAWAARGSLTAHPSHAASAYNGIPYSMKNIWECKVGERIWVEGAVMRDSRADGQTYAMVLKGEIQNANDPWTGTKSASFRHIRMDNVAGAIQINNRFVADPTLNGAVITAATNATPIVCTRGAIHSLATGDTVVVGGGLGNTAMNGTWVVTVVNSTQFSLNTSVGSGEYTGGGKYGVVPRLAGDMQLYNIACTNVSPVDSSVFVEGASTRAIQLSDSPNIVFDRITVDGPGTRDGPMFLSGTPAIFAAPVVRRFIAPRGLYGPGAQALSEGDASVAATLGTPTWENNILWGSTASPDKYDGVATTTLLASRSDVGFAGDSLNISGTYAASSVDEAELARFTDGLEGP